MHPDVLAYITSAPENMQPALRDLRSLIVNAYIDAEEGMYDGKFPQYTQRDKIVCSFALRAKGIMLYLCDDETVAKYEPQLGKLVSGKACVLYKETRAMKATQLRHIVKE